MELVSPRGSSSSVHAYSFVVGTIVQTVTVKFPIIMSIHTLIPLQSYSEGGHNLLVSASSDPNSDVTIKVWAPKVENEVSTLPTRRSPSKVVAEYCTMMLMLAVTLQLLNWIIPVKPIIRTFSHFPWYRY